MLDASARAQYSDETAAGRGLSRRQLVKAGAWSAPAIVLATAVPAHAVSVSSVQLSAVRGNGNSYNITLTVTGAASPAARAVVPNASPTGGIVWDTPLPTSVTEAGPYYGVLHVSGQSIYTLSVSVGGVLSNAVTLSKK